MHTKILVNLVNGYKKQQLDNFFSSTKSTAVPLSAKLPLSTIKF